MLNKVLKARLLFWEKNTVFRLYRNTIFHLEMQNNYFDPLVNLLVTVCEMTFSYHVIWIKLYWSASTRIMKLCAD